MIKKKFDKARISDVVGAPKPRNPRGKYPTYGSPTPNWPRELIPKTRHSKPEPRQFRKLCKITKKYHQNQQKIKNFFFWNLFYIYFFTFLPFKVDKLAHTFLWRFFEKKIPKKILLIMNFRHIFTKFWNPENPRGKYPTYGSPTPPPKS